MNSVPILFTFDQSLLMPAGVCLTSLLESANPDTFYDIFILHKEGCDFSDLHKLEQRFSNFRLTCRKVKGEFVGAYEIRGIPETAYYRLLSPEMIPEYDKLLYFDVDVIIREDLTKYYELNLNDNYFAAVDTCSVLQPDENRYITEELQLNRQNGYYNSGALVINSSLIRDDDKISEFRLLGKNNYKYQDQDIINIACNGRFMVLSPSFNMTVQIYSLIMEHRGEMEALYGSEVLDAALDHGIVHYNGAKPWKAACPNMDIWWSAYRRSVFFDETFCHSFWVSQRELLVRLPLIKRIKILLRYPLDKKEMKDASGNSRNHL